MLFLLSYSTPPECRAGEGPGTSGAGGYVEETGPSMLVEAGGCDPDLRPFEVGFVGSHRAWDAALDVAVSGGFAYVADGLSGFQILDIGDPASPELVGAHDTPGYAQGIAVRGGYAYVADGGGGLRIIDVSSPSSPVAAGSCLTGGFAYGIAVNGGYAYVGAGAGGLQVIDVSNPNMPFVVGDHDICSTAWGVAISGDVAYVAGGAGGLHVVDISNPAFPVKVGCYESYGTAFGVAVAGDFAFVAGGDRGLQVVSVGDLQSMMLVAKCDSPDFAYGVEIVNNYAYVAGGADGLQVLQARTVIALDDPDPGPPTALSNPGEGSVGAGSARPYSNHLGQNSPNPFASRTRIAFSTEVGGHVRLRVFDAMGRLVRTLVDGTRGSSDHVEYWDGKDQSGRPLPPGAYFYRLEAPGWTDVKKMTLAG